MATKTKNLPKSECRRFATAASALIERHGCQLICATAVNEITGTSTESIYDSKFGPLRLSVSERTTGSGGPGDIFTRFEFARLAAPQTGCNPCSGKWNHHYFAEWSVKEALADIERWLKRIHPTSLESFADETSIQPGLVAHTVIAERCPAVRELCDPPYAFAGGNGLDHEASAAWFTKHAERRAIFLWDCNPRIRTILRGVSGRDTLYAFVHHWLDAYTENQPQYRKKCPLLTVD